MDEFSRRLLERQLFFFDEATSLLHLLAKDNCKNSNCHLHKGVKKLKPPGFEASFDARAARTCAAILSNFISWSLACCIFVFWPVIGLGPHDADLREDKTIAESCFLHARARILHKRVLSTRFTSPSSDRPIICQNYPGEPQHSTIALWTTQHVDQRCIGQDYTYLLKEGHQLAGTPLVRAGKVEVFQVEYKTLAVLGTVDTAGVGADHHAHLEKREWVW